MLDLFCGAGGSAVGYNRAGFNVTGVDHIYQPNYPFEFICEDAIKYLEQYGNDYDIITASPPCQGYGKTVPRSNGAPRLIKSLRKILRESNKPYVIENVVGAPLINPIVLCGIYFGLGVVRHRLFESNVKLFKIQHVKHPKNFFTVVGHENGTLQDWKNAMGIDWMTRKELTQAIPPVYTEYIGKQLRKWIQ